MRVAHGVPDSLGRYAHEHVLGDCGNLGGLEIERDLRAVIPRNFGHGSSKGFVEGQIGRKRQRCERTARLDEGSLGGCSDLAPRLVGGGETAALAHEERKLLCEPVVEVTSEAATLLEDRGLREALPVPPDLADDGEEYEQVEEEAEGIPD